MENFIVSARKYRPATFDTVVGQAHITNTLKNAIRNNHLAQAFLFCGPRGVGKTTCARILAKTINCQNITSDTEACDQCESCLSFKNGNSMNIHELDAASNNSVDDIRSLVEQVRYAPQSGKYKIYIIDEVHMLSTSAFNAFLKTLEEPPPYAIFILATTEKHKIIPTILSRCQIFDFNRIQVEDIASHLAYIAKSEGLNAEPDALHTIAQKADGALRDALSIFDQIVSFSGASLTYRAVIDNLNILDYDYYFKITDAIINENVKDVLLIFDDILNKGFDGNNCINGLGEHFRNLLVCKDESTLKLLKVSENVKEKYKMQSSQASVSLLMTGLNITNQCDIYYKSSKNQRLHVELALMKLCHIPSAIKLSQLPDEEVKKKLSTSTVNASQETKESPETIAAPISASPGIPPKKNIKSQGTGSIKLPSFDDIRNGNYSASKEENKEAETESVNSSKNEFNESDFLKSWNECITIIEQQNKISLHTLLSGLKPLLKESFRIEIEVINKVQADMLHMEKTELLGHLRNKLNNFSIDFDIVINQEQEVFKPYTNSEKFKVLIEKNPNLLELKNRLDLEID
jgi:DNA polymerase III subunit gamma/tau